MHERRCSCLAWLPESQLHRNTFHAKRSTKKKFQADKSLNLRYQTAIPSKKRRSNEVCVRISSKEKWAVPA
ncbi:hypothetical protein BDA96_05G119600 [Sorghum bicolor]|uniref:Uncharacterized protein n=1 Tax=Sorghum bicolor TaxID=4558 RepID=A0A921UG64_SORBI|nr:hypothetical protein BDA96_05G119600 [Sorghum bicolor]